MKYFPLFYCYIFTFVIFLGYILFVGDLTVCRNSIGYKNKYFTCAFMQPIRYFMCKQFVEYLYNSVNVYEDKYFQ